MDYDKLIHCLKCCARVDAQNVGCDDCGLEYCGEECQQLCGTAATAIETLRAALARVTAERDGAVEELENYMVQDVVEGNEPCGICAKASNIPCECCDPKWRSIKKED